MESYCKLWTSCLFIFLSFFVTFISIDTFQFACIDIPFAYEFNISFQIFKSIWVEPRDSLIKGDTKHDQ